MTEKNYGSGWRTGLFIDNATTTAPPKSARGGEKGITWIFNAKTRSTIILTLGDNNWIN